MEINLQLPSNGNSEVDFQKFSFSEHLLRHQWAEGWSVTT
jgi:hypothetical protein